MTFDEWDWKEIVGSYLRDFRKSRGWKKLDVQAKTGLSMKTISAIEKGEFLGRISKIQKYMALAELPPKATRMKDVYLEMSEIGDVFVFDEDEDIRDVVRSPGETFN